MSEHTTQTSHEKPIRVAVLCAPGLEALDLVGSCEMFAFTASLAAEAGFANVPGYDVQVGSVTDPGDILAWRGLRVVSEQTYRDVELPVDTLVIPPLHHHHACLEDQELIAWVREASRQARRTVAFCTGAYLLASAGLLEGCRTATHWAFTEDMRERFPDVAVDGDPIFIKQGNLYTSAGATAAFDLMLALIEEDYGTDVARYIAQYFVLFLKRPGGQSQFSTQLNTQFADRDVLRDLQAWILDHLEDDLTVDALAERVAMSPRNFRRVFTRDVGVTPARYVEQARLEAARRHLEDSTQGVEAIAATCGFHSPETMRATFVRALGISPAAYRNRFASAHTGR